jgi:hypothetical protein
MKNFFEIKLDFLCTALLLFDPMSTAPHKQIKAIAAALQRDRAPAVVLQTSALVLGLVLVLIISLTGSGYV